MGTNTIPSAGTRASGYRVASRQPRRALTGPQAALFAAAMLVASGAWAETLEEARTSLRAAETAFAQAFADRDVERFLSFVAADGVFLGGNEVARGPEAVRAAWARLFEPKTPPFSWRPERVEVLESGGLGLSTGPIFDPQGKRTGSYISTWRRRGDGAWEVVFDGGPPPCPRCECAAPDGADPNGE